MNIIEHRNQLNNYGVTLHSRIVGVLVDRIETAIASGTIRSQNSKHSIFDFIRIILMVKNERDAWKRLCANDPHTVAICDSVKFDRTDGKAANLESPATDIVGLLYIAYQATAGNPRNWVQLARA